MLVIVISVLPKNALIGSTIDLTCNITDSQLLELKMINNEDIFSPNDKNVEG